VHIFKEGHPNKKKGAQETVGGLDKYWGGGHVRTQMQKKKEKTGGVDDRGGKKSPAFTPIKRKLHREKKLNGAGRGGGT